MLFGTTLRLSALRDNDHDDNNNNNDDDDDNNERYDLLDDGERSRRRRRPLLWLARCWLLFNGILALVFGALHQAGVVRALSYLHDDATLAALEGGVKPPTPTTAFFVGTYTPPSSFQCYLFWKFRRFF